MMTSILNTIIPSGYAVCQHTDSQRAATDLHQLAYAQLLEDEQSIYLHLIKPRLYTNGDDCKYYRDPALVIFAKGFTNFQKQMFPGQYEQFMYRLIGKFGCNPYFKQRRGERLLPPDKQQIVPQVLKDVGVTTEMKFDAYEDILVMMKKISNTDSLLQGYYSSTLCGNHIEASIKDNNELTTGISLFRYKQWQINKHTIRILLRCL